MIKKELTIAGALLYACEGTKARRDFRYKDHYIYSIELTNSRPEIIKLFMRFLREILQVKEERLRGQLFLYPDHDVQKLIQYWSEVSGISVSQFQKVILLQQKNSKYKPNPLGTFKVRYNHKVDFMRLQTLISKIWTRAKVG